MLNKILSLIGAAVVIVLASMSHAAGQTQSSAVPLSVAPENGLKLIIAMLVFACLVGFYFLKRANLVGFRANGKNNISLEQQHYISAKERVIVMRVESERFLLGVTPSQINLIARLGAAEEGVGSIVDDAVSKKVTNAYKASGQAARA